MDDTVLVIGAGVDKVLGLPLMNELIPRISEFTKNEGSHLDTVLRSRLPRMSFKFEKFIDQSIEVLAQEFNKEIEKIIISIQQEITEHEQQVEKGESGTLSSEDLKTGKVIITLLEKIKIIKETSRIDNETEELIKEILGVSLEQFTIIDEKHFDFSSSFKDVLKAILRKSLEKPEHVIYKHIQKKLLDIEELLVKHFVGFYTGNEARMKDYIYISWMLWAFLKNEESKVLSQEGCSKINFYSSIPEDWKVVSFNYTIFTEYFSNNSPLYFHGNLTSYIDIQNKTKIQIQKGEEYDNLDINKFADSILANCIDFSGKDSRAIIPFIVPPLKLKPVLAKEFVNIWHDTDKFMAEASNIVIVGYSFNSNDDYFNALLKTSKNKKIFIIDKNISDIKKRLKNLLNFPDKMSPGIIQNKHTEKFDEITFINCDANEIKLETLITS